jgi:NAD+ kinase
MSAPKQWHNPPPRRWLVLYHAVMEGAPALADDIVRYLTRNAGVAAEAGSFDDLEMRAHIADQDMVVVLGGDGSMLRAGRLAARHQVPVLGVNLGRLAFLAEVQRPEWQEVLARVLSGDYWIEERMMLRVEHWRAEQLLGSHDVLNEVVIGRGGLARPVRLKTLIDGGELTTYVADGLIIATPTGSTAYALAAGGPILPPELKNILLIAIAPHLSMERAIVLAQGATVEVIPYSDHKHQAIMSPDGQMEEVLLNGDRVSVCMSKNAARFVRVRPQTYFYAGLMARMANNPAANRND